MPERPVYTAPPTPLYPTARPEALHHVYAPQSRGFFLSRMQRALAASGAGILHTIPGTIVHRLLALPAEQLARLSFAFSQAAVRAVRESAYRAWMDPQLFPERGAATFAQGYVTCALVSPAQRPIFVPKGALFGTSSGMVLRAAEESVCPVGESLVRVRVIAEAPGEAGNAPAGSVTRLISAGAPEIRSVNNASPIMGGREEESDEEMYVRFQDFVESRATGNRLAVYSAARNARVPGERATDAALIHPWLIEHVNAEMGCGHVVLDAGYGGASRDLLAAAQAAVNRVQSSGQVHGVIAASAWVVPVTIRGVLSRVGDEEAARGALQRAWNRLLRDALVEDGRGRGRITRFQVLETLARCSGDLVDIDLSLQEDLQPPIGARIVAGECRVELVRGELWRP